MGSSTVVTIRETVAQRVSRRYELFPFMHPVSEKSKEVGQRRNSSPLPSNPSKVAMPAEGRTNVSVLLLGNREDSSMHHSSSVDYMGNVIVPVVTKEPSGFISAAIITDENGDGQATGALGCFASEEQARQFTVEYAKSEIERRRFMTLTD
jgi:hypothetical protein